MRTCTRKFSSSCVEMGGFFPFPWLKTQHYSLPMSQDTMENWITSLLVTSWKSLRTWNKLEHHWSTSIYCNISGIWIALGLDICFYFWVCILVFDKVLWLKSFVEYWIENGCLLYTKRTNIEYFCHICTEAAGVLPALMKWSCIVVKCFIIHNL